jgi:predicted nicotinamide N-methyase
VSTTDSLPADLAALDARFEISRTEISLPSGAVTLVHPHDYDDLISEADYVKDERLPYWADLWPSAIALATILPSLTPIPGRAIELGCGLGLVTVAALRAGHEVLSTDYYEDALLFARRNAWSAAGREPAVRMVDWRAWPDDVGRFDLILASDVLYEESYAALIASAIARSLAPGGVALIADPGRKAFGTFVAECSSFGLAMRERAKVPHDDGKVHQMITIYEVTAATR